MLPVLFEIPTPFGKVPIYGFGLMLVIALFVSTWLACRRALKEGIAKERVQDLALWVVICGILGARIVYMIQYKRPLSEFLQLWQGGLVFYGSLIGGAVGMLLAHIFVFRKYHLSWLKMADIITPSVAIGLAIGRIGCLLNGCCYGDVACPQCVALHYPLSGPAHAQLVGRGLQTAAGFTLAVDPKDNRTLVDRVEPGSAAAEAGLNKGDYVVGFNGQSNRMVLQIFADRERLEHLEEVMSSKWHGDVKPIEILDEQLAVLRIRYPRDADEAPSSADFNNLRADEDETKTLGHFDERRTDDLWQALVGWPRSRQTLQLTVHRDGEDITLPAFRPVSLGLHPTQVYETISMTLLFLLLTAYFPFRRLEGQIVGLFLTLYAVHRFLNELLRNDTDPVAFGMTLSQNISVLALLVGLALLNRDRLARGLQPVRRALVGG